MDMNITPLDNKKKKIIGWMIYGICKKCEKIIVINITKDSEKPVLDRDYRIDYNKTGEGEELK